MMEQDQVCEHDYCVSIYPSNPDVLSARCMNCNEYSEMPTSWQINCRLLVQNWIETHPANIG